MLKESERAVEFFSRSFEKFQGAPGSFCKIQEVSGGVVGRFNEF